MKQNIYFQHSIFVPISVPFLELTGGAPPAVSHLPAGQSGLAEGGEEEQEELGGEQGGGREQGAEE